jgi:hypothetical protein
MARIVVRTLADLGDDVAFAPERHVAARLGGKAGGVPLASLVTERVERVAVRDLARAVVLDTTHAKDGVLDVRAAGAAKPAGSAKRRVRDGDLLVSRLRPYLRQIGLAHPSAVREAGMELLACSTEFHVLASRDGGDLAFLVPWLLGDEAQAALAAGQEGGHHPRVPKETLLALRVPRALVEAREAISRDVRASLAALYAAQGRYAAVLRGSGGVTGGRRVP